MKGQITEAQKMSGNEADYALKTELKANLMECFKKGPKFEIENELETADDLQGLIKNAIFIERSLEARKILRESSGPKQDQTDKNKDDKKGPLVCQVCNLGRHDASQCKSMNLLAITCRKCHRIDHLTEECTFSLPQPTNFGSPCQTCNRVGHSTDECRKNLKCQWCNGNGHSADQCYKRMSDGNHPTFTCQSCRKPGHAANQCRQHNMIKCQICNSFGHTANQCRNQAPSKPNGQIGLKPEHEAISCYFRYHNPKIIARPHLTCQNCDRTRHTAATYILRPSQDAMPKVCAYCKIQGREIAVQTNEILSELLPFN